MTLYHELFEASLRPKRKHILAKSHYLAMSPNKLAYVGSNVLYEISSACQLASGKH